MVGSLRRGEVFWADLDPVIGHEQGRRRPCVVVQNDVGNAHSPTTIVAVITSRLRRRAYPFLVDVPTSSLARPSQVNCAQIRTVDTSRLVGERIAKLDDATMREVDSALAASLGLY